MINDGANPQLPFFQQVNLITPDIARFHVIQPFLKVLPKILDRPQIRTHRALGVVPAHEFFAHLLHDWCHTELLSLRQNVCSWDPYAEGVRRINGFVQVA
jgi:hypothetical protein